MLGPQPEGVIAGEPLGTNLAQQDRLVNSLLQIVPGSICGPADERPLLGRGFAIPSQLYEGQEPPRIRAE